MNSDSIQQGVEDAAVSLSDNEHGTIQSIERAANILSLLNQETRVLRPAFVAERLGLNRTTAYRYLQSLQATGFLNASFGPGPLFDQVSALVSERQEILTLAPTIMRQVADSTGLTTVLSFLGRSGAIVTLVEEANEGTIVLTVHVGTVLELKAAQSRALLAYQVNPDVAARLHANLSPSEARAEQEELAKVRRNGIAWADLGRIGLASVAAPVFGGRDVQAAMGILGTTAVLAPGQGSEERVETLRAAAEHLSSMIGA
ncbi:IclR family transcriptional regulator [Lacisediminihabitans profunda]|uniref:Helix-turn-helix domain-containing protein n=1 Tax=Lacisediminihabitans profunda TaxID=2594790 RepID=A0A5C8UQZ5_9MICO|nr:helix-turn-helix domain-containing protein [Lacisediminihabitans profunda]TXN29970.1 helix-turn-helix domain-containing protein [Lacisediminihabitans profunda]